MRFTRWRTWCLVGALAVSVLTGCDKNEPAKNETEINAATLAEQGESVVGEIDESARAAVEAKLAEADALDGTIDRIVHRCASCALGMDGKSEHALEVAGYTLHFCSGHCKESFAKDLTKSILDLEIPEE